MKTIIKKSMSLLLVFCMLISLVTVQITALAAEDSNVASDLEYLHSSAVPNADNSLFATATELLAPDEKKDGYRYVYVGSNVFSNYIIASAFTEKQSNYTNEKPMYTDANGTSYYVGGSLSAFKNRKLMVNGLYLNGTYVEGSFPARYDYVQQFTIQDTENEKYATVYCADQVTTAVKGFFYDIENVEDANYYTKEQAEMIRSIVINGYWGTESGIGSIDNIKKMMRDSNKFTDDEINSLTDGIALSATQFAIWNFSNAMSGVKVVNTYFATKVMDAFVPSQDPVKSDVDLLFKLYNHLINLDPTPVEKTTADTIINKDNFIKNIEIIPYQAIKDHPNNLDENKTNDVFNCNLSFTMDVLPSALRGDSLVANITNEKDELIATGRIVGDLKPGELQLVAKGFGRYMFEDLPLEEGTQNIKIHIVGEQQLSQNAYLYTSEVKEGESSQTFVGIANGMHKVDTELSYKVEFEVKDDIDGNKESLFVDCKTDRFEITVEVPGGDGIKEHDEVIIMVDGSYSMDEEWDDMKEVIIEIGKTVLDGSGHTQLTLMAFGISPTVVLEHITSVDELKNKLPEKPGGLLYGRSATNCDGAFEGISWYINEHDETLDDVNVIFLSDGGVNLNSNHVDWIAIANKLSASNALNVQTSEFTQVVMGNANISEASKTVYGEQLDGLLAKWKYVIEAETLLGELDAELSALDPASEEYATVKAQFDTLLSESNNAYKYVANVLNTKNASGKTNAQQWVVEVYKDFYEFAGLTEGERYPVYVAEYAYVDYQKATNAFLYHTFYYVLGYAGISSDNANGMTGYYAHEEATKLAQNEKVEDLYIIRFKTRDKYTLKLQDYDSRSNWMTKVEGAECIDGQGIDTLVETLENTLTKLGTTPYNDVIVTDYMSKWVNLDPTTLKIVDKNSGVIIWTAKDGWLVEEALRPTSKEIPVIVELVPESEYEKGGADVVGNTSGVIYKLTWFIKDGALLRSDSMQLKYDVTADVEEEGFEFDVHYPANGTTKITYTDDHGVEREKPIKVPDIFIKRPKSVEVLIEGIKNLDGNPAKGFKFELVENGNVLGEAISGEDGKFSFEPMVFDIESEHKFTINEVVTNDEGIVYDTTVYTVNLSIERECGKYVAYITYEKNDAEYNGKIIFNNKTTTPAEVELEGEKLFDNEAADGFEFVLMQGENVIETVESKNGKFNFKKLTFTKSGTYVYTVKEVLGNNEQIVYDESIYTVVVTVSRVGEEFKATVDYLKDGKSQNSIKFENKTTESAKAEISGEKYFDGILKDGYKFELIQNNNVLETVESENGRFTFSELTFDRSGIYTYIVKEVTDDNVNIVYDEREYIVIITVTRVGDKFVSTVEYREGSDKVDSIKFENKTTTPAEVVLNGNKYFNGIPAANYEFALIQGGKVIETVKSDENGKFAFGKMTFNSINRYEYQIVEVEGDDVNVVYDKVLYNVAIVVTREGDKFVAKVSYEKDNEEYNGELDFNNKPVFPTDAVLGGKKLFDGKGTAGYTFALAQNGKIIDVAKSGEDGTFNFKKIDYTKVGEYTYDIYEIIGDDEGVVYDKTVHTVTVFVKRVGNALRVTLSTPNAIVFENKTTPPAEVTLEGEKYLDGILADGFEFVLIQNDRVIETVESKDGKFAFSTLTFDKSGEYEYVIKEVIGDNEQIVYDEKEIKVIVTVKREGEKFVAEVETNEKIVFNNKTTVSTEVTLGGVKYFDGILADGFEFVLMQGDKVIETVGSKNGKYTFSPLVFDKSGKYEYVVKEVIGDNEQIVYDEKEIEVVITVIRDGEKFVATVASSEAMIFNNKTTSPAKVTLEGEKYFDGNLADGFEFVLVQGDRVISTATSENGKFSFNELTFDKSGKYEYVIKEVLGNEEYIVYDEKEIKVTVTVTREGDKFVTVVETSEDIVFNNKTVRPTEITLEGEKYFDGNLADGFEFVLMQGDRVIETVGSKNGKFSFSTLKYDRAGQFEYIIKEVLGNDEQIVYDEKEIKVVVTVIREGEDYVATVETDEDIVFNNKTVESVEVILGGNKYLDGELAGGFEFALMNGENVLETVKSDENGRFAFSTLTFDKVGEYKYTVVEVKGNDDMIEYDETVFEINVTVTREGETLVATVEGADEIEFYNGILEDIPEESVPLAPPATGDKSITALLIMSITSLIIGALTAIRRRRDI